MALAIFDLDHTLINGDSDHAWGQFLVENELVDPIEYKQKNDWFFEQYLAGGLDVHEYLAFALKPLTQFPLDQLLQLRDRFLKECIIPIISRKSRELIAQHREQGDTLLIITATNGFITYPIAQLLGIDQIIAPHPEFINGAYTGKIVGVPSFQHGKVIRLQDWLAEHQQSLEGSWFYSDSDNDLPLLEIVDNPVAVDPCAKLETVAKARQWPIISLRD